MSNIPISSLPLAITLDGSEEVPIVQGGTTKRTTVGVMSSFLSSVIIGTTPIIGGTTNGLLYDHAGKVGNLATAPNGVLVTSAGGVPSISTTLPTGLTIPAPTVTGGLTLAGLTLADETININGSPVVYLPNQATFVNSLAIGDGLRQMTQTLPFHGTDNIAIGFGVLPGVTTGYYNIGIGAEGTLGLVTTGHGNIVLGRSSGFSITTGLDNTIVGGSAGLAITTELDNCAFGVNAIRNIAGAENCAFGGDTGLNSVSGNQNIFIGGLAARFLGDNVTGKTTGDLGIYIGYNSHASADGLTNEIVIGGAATGLGSNTIVLGNDSNLKTRTRGTLLIDTSTVDAVFNPRLQIKSTTVDASNPVPLVVLDRQNSTTPALIVGVDSSTNPTIAVNGGSSLLFGAHATGTLAFTQYMSLNNGVANVATGFQIGGTAASGNVLSGNGTNFVSTALSGLTAGNATNVGITNDNTTNATMNLAWVTSNAGNLPVKVSSSKFVVNPSTGNLSAVSFSGAGSGLTGTAAGLTAGNVTTNANLTGPITSVGNATSIASQTGTGTKFVVDTSPTLTGTPLTPTAAVDTNTTQIASTAFVLAQAASATPIVDGTPTVGTSTRYARGDHIHPTDTTRAPLASPTFTGTVTIPAGASITTPVLTGLPTGTGVATANTASTLVARDGSGNFSAGTIIASLTGHASLDLALTGGTLSGGLTFSTSSAFADATLFYNSTFGMSLGTKAGSVNDLSIFNPGGGAVLMKFPTGTTNVIFGGTIGSAIAPTAISGAGPFLTGSASTLNSRMKVNLGGIDYWIPCSTTAF